MLVGTCVMKTEEEEGASCSPPPISSGPSIHPKTDLPVDTVTDSTKTRFYKVTKTPALTSLITRGYKNTRSWQRFMIFPLSSAWTKFTPSLCWSTGRRQAERTQGFFANQSWWIYSLRKNETYHDAVEKWQSLDIQVKQVAGEPHLNHNHPSSTQHKVR